MSAPLPFRKIYGTPLVLAGVTFCGLMSALLGDGLWDTISWFVLAVPLAVVLWKYCRRPSLMGSRRTAAKI
jgi:hypothetical protein